jgi:prepilin-type N-terminal cleavage/methylation domain-containing protein
MTKRRNNNHNNKGFTLIELLLAMALMTILMLVITDIISSIINAQSQSESVSSTTQDGRFIMSRLDYDVQRASAVTTPATLGGSGSNLAITIGGTAYTYALNSGNLQLTVGADTSNLNGSDTTISGLTFQRIGNVGGKDTVRMTFTVTSKITTKSGAESRTFTTTFGRRL